MVIKKATAILLLLSIVVVSVAGCAGTTESGTSSADMSSSAPATEPIDETPFVAVLDRDMEDLFYRQHMLALMVSGAYTYYEKPQTATGDASSNTTANNLPTTPLVTIDPSCTLAQYQEIYDLLVDAASHCKTDVILPYPITALELSAMGAAISFDHPEFYHLQHITQGGAFRFSTVNEKQVYIYYQYEMSEIPTYNARLKNVVEPLLQEARTYESPLDQAAYLYYWIIDNMNVNWTEFNNTQRSTIAEMLLEHHGVCIGFANLLAYLMTSLGTPAVVNLGYLPSTVVHSWITFEYNGFNYGCGPYDGREKRVTTEYSPAQFFMMDSYDIFTKLQVQINLVSTTLPDGKPAMLYVPGVVPGKIEA